MKISLGMNLQSGAWGGGNQFGHSLAEYLHKNGVEVSFDLKKPDLDLIMLTEPRSNLKSSSYTQREIIRYLISKNNKAIVVHRINECDERKGTKDVNRMLIYANSCADHTIFISSWLRNLFFEHGLKTLEQSVVLNGANNEVFNLDGYIPWNGSGKIRIVTHHWGGGYLKGFDIYDHLDKLLSDPKFNKRFEFTYIGNLPHGSHFANTNCIPPLSGIELVKSIRNNHIYLTASKNEPAGMHHIEGAMCGLPLLYRESGALPEYCNGFGVSFRDENFEEKLEEMMATYDKWVNRMKYYPHTSEKMCEDYFDLFVKLLDRKGEILKNRRWWRYPYRIGKLLI